MEKILGSSIVQSEELLKTIQREDEMRKSAAEQFLKNYPKVRKTLYEQKGVEDVTGTRTLGRLRGCRILGFMNWLCRGTRRLLVTWWCSPVAVDVFLPILISIHPCDA